MLGLVKALASAASGASASTRLVAIALGALLLVGYSSRSIHEDKALIGDLFFLLSSCMGSAYLVYVQQHAVNAMQGTALVAVYSAVAAGLLVLVWPTPLVLWTLPTSELFVQAVYQGVGLGACAVLFASYAALRLGSQRLAVFIATIPVLSLILGHFIAGDSIHSFEAAAVVLVSMGIILAGFFHGSGTVSSPQLKQSADLTIQRRPTL